MFIPQDGDSDELLAIIQTNEEVLKKYDNEVNNLHNQMELLKKRMIQIHQEMKHVNNELSLALIQREGAKSLLDELNERYLMWLNK